MNILHEKMSCFISDHKSQTGGNCVYSMSHCTMIKPTTNARMKTCQPSLGCFSASPMCTAGGDTLSSSPERDVSGGFEASKEKHE